MKGKKNKEAEAAARTKEATTQEAEFKRALIKAGKAVIIFFIIYLSVYKLYHVSVKKHLNYDEVDYVYIKSGSVNHRLNEDGLELVVDSFNDFTHIKRNPDCSAVGTPEYSLGVKLKSGEDIHMIPASDTWSVEWHNMDSMNWLDAWGNAGADSGSLYYWGDSSELREMWDEVLLDVYGVTY